MATTKVLRIEYEIPPLRAIYFSDFHDDGWTDEEAKEFFIGHEQGSRVRKITRLELETEAPDGE